ncbi:MAG: formylglycine-generating enzyme family protein, partial [Bacteroidales bacterium]|nr:formylglycine-generating enzyme family protein [Bacteroidales bacterium]
PVVCSWVSAVAFCEKLSEMTGKKYRLPTEAEWEYAARGGQHRDGTRYAGSNSYYEVAWTGPLRREPRPVGQKKPNGLGLYDMSGNVQEWCSDWYGENYYSYSPSVNPQGPSSGSDRVVRGGSVDYYQNMFRCRVALRDHESPAMYAVTAYSVGFRVVCEP